jgi:hypothetical protein
MRLNVNTVVTGQRVVLVPYRPEHVPLYHKWMQSPELQVWNPPGCSTEALRLGHPHSPCACSTAARGRG